MKQHVQAIAIAAVAVALTSCGSDDSAALVGSSPAPTSVGQPVSPNFGVDPCNIIEPDEVADILGSPGISPERTYTGNTSDACQWGDPDGALLKTAFTNQPLDKAPTTPEGDQLSEALGVPTSLLRSGASSCRLWTTHPEDRTFLFTVTLPDDRRPADVDASANTSCDHYVPFLKTVIARLDWR